jgi:uncharacterized protein YndB with AHSA1/START domain
MSRLELSQAPVARTGMLIRRPAAEVFAAFADPAVTTRFWFTRGSGPLVQGASVKWEWEMYDASTEVTVRLLQPHRRIVIEWDGATGRNEVEWKFAALQPDATFVEVRESGWTGSGDDLVAHVLDATSGFTWVLAGCKAWLEHGVRLKLVEDRFPRGPGEPYPEA